MEINWRNIAEMAYEKYVETLKQAGYPTYEHRAWNKLDVNKRLAWITAVKTACEAYGRAATA